jgi:hypothetical protein
MAPGCLSVRDDSRPAPQLIDIGNLIQPFGRGIRVLQATRGLKTRRTAEIRRSGTAVSDTRSERGWPEVPANCKSFKNRG